MTTFSMACYLQLSTSFAETINFLRHQVASAQIIVNIYVQLDTLYAGLADVHHEGRA